MSDERPAPRRNPGLLGHGASERVLIDAWASGRLPHAWLIGGPAGIGKATLAFRFARFLLANGDHSAGGLFGAPSVPDSLAVAPDNPVFARVAAGGHGNLLTIERTFDEKRGRVRQEIVVDEARRISPFLRQTANEVGWRVVVVDGVDAMNSSGQNAILKLLEEPPARSVLLLTADNPGALLPTIRSRCRKLRLDPLPDTTVDLLLAGLRPDLADRPRAALVRLAGGSIGRALDLADADALTLLTDFLDIVATAPGMDPRAIQGFADRVTGRRNAETAYETATTLMVWWLARLARQTALGEALPEIVDGEGGVMRRLMAHPRGLERWLDVWEKVDRLFLRADNANLDRKQVVMTALGIFDAAAA
jgi:DNA polymerase III subunit delta'